MARFSKSTTKFSNVLSYFLVVLLIVGLCGFVVFFTNGLTEDFKSFYVVVNGKPVLSELREVNVTSIDPLKVDVRYVFDGLSENSSGYKVRISANPESDFVFMLNGKSTYLKDCDVDFSTAFDLNLNEKDFVLKPRGFNTTEILKALFPGKTIEADNSIQNSELFVLTIMSYDEKASVSIYFSVYDMVKNIELDKTEIVF